MVNPVFFLNFRGFLVDFGGNPRREVPKTAKNAVFSDFSRRARRFWGFGDFCDFGGYLPSIFTPPMGPWCFGDIGKTLYSQSGNLCRFSIFGGSIIISAHLCALIIILPPKLR